MSHSDDKKYQGKAAFEEIASRLGIFGSGFQDAFAQIAEAVDKIEKEGGQTGDTTDFTVNTDKGPVQARAGWSVRVGGLGGGMGAQGDDFSAEPINKGTRGKANPGANSGANPGASAASAPVREPHVETYEEGEVWVLVVELPGTRALDLRLTPEADTLVIETLGARQFKTTITPPASVDLDQLEQRFVNGVLEVRAPLNSAPSEETRDE